MRKPDHRRVHLPANRVAPTENPRRTRTWEVACLQRIGFTLSSGGRWIAAVAMLSGWRTTATGICQSTGTGVWCAGHRFRSQEPGVCNGHRRRACRWCLRL